MLKQKGDGGMNGDDVDFLQVLNRLRMVRKQWLCFDVTAGEVKSFKDASKDVCRQAIPFQVRHSKPL